MTTRDSLADRVDTLDLGADDHLVEPVALAGTPGPLPCAQSLPVIIEAHANRYADSAALFQALD